MEKLITVCIIDHLNLISQAYPLLLQEHSELNVIVVGGTMPELKNYIAGHTHIPEVFLIDIKLFKNNSTNIVRWLHDTYPASKLIAISDSLKHAKIHAMMMSGCTAFFGMDIQVSQLYKGICAVYNDSFSCREDNYIDKESFMKAKNYNGYPVVLFSLQEQDIIGYICAGFTNDEIDLEINLKHGGANYHINNIFQKLNIHNRSDLMKMALHLGMLEDEMVN